MWFIVDFCDKRSYESEVPDGKPFSLCLFRQFSKEPLKNRRVTGPRGYRRAVFRSREADSAGIRYSFCPPEAHVASGRHTTP